MQLAEGLEKTIAYFDRLLREIFDSTRRLLARGRVSCDREVEHLCCKEGIWKAYVDSRSPLIVETGVHS